MLAKTLTLLALSLVSLALGAAQTQAPDPAPALPRIVGETFNITQYGALGDGAATNTLAIQAAIQAANRAGGGTVQIPRGVFLSGPIELASGIRLRLDEGAILRMLPLSQYPGGTQSPKDFISGSKLHDIAMSGPGAIDGQGAPWWPHARVEGDKRPRMIALSGCERVLIEQLTLSNSPKFHISIGGNSSNITVRRVTIRANSSSDPVAPGHNTDACDVSAKHVLIQDCDVSVGDDNFTCGGGTSDVLITNCAYGNGHGVSIGSPIHGGISNLTVIHCTFNNTDTGIRIKSDRDRGGLVQNIRYFDIKMTNVGIPILIYAAYAATNREYRNLQKLTPELASKYPASPVTDRTPVYRDIVFSNITATVRSGSRAGLIWGLPEKPASNIVMQKVEIRAEHPFGIFDAKNVQLENCLIITPQGTNQLATTNAQVTCKP